MIRFYWNNILFDITDIGGGPLGEDIPKHAHAKNSYELHFIVGGKGKLITDTNEYMLSTGDFFITGPNIYHEQTADKNEPVKDVFIMLQAVNTAKPNVISSTFLENHFCFFKHFDISTAKEILSEFRSKKTDYKSAVSGLAIKLLTDITRYYLPDSFEKNISTDGLYDKRFVIIEQAFLYTPDLTLTELSNKIGVCERQTQRVLKKYYGKTFREKKNDSKLN
ncbi:MAG: cupin domain-containing protein, partial [Eubacterium sp.]|nr:cupin domain-containing protein [Eubacterium sp.]